jgi:hypothetical protein
MLTRVVLLRLLQLACFCLYYCFAENTPVPVRVTRVRDVTSAGPVNQFTSAFLSIL